MSSPPARTPAPARRNRWLKRLGARFKSQPDLPPREMLEAILRTDAETARALAPQERAMLLRILDFGQMRVEDVMVPRADIVAIDEAASMAELLNVFRSQAHSRIPVYRDTLDDPRGLIHIKDFMRWMTQEAREDAPQPQDQRATIAKPARLVASPETAEGEMPKDPIGLIADPDADDDEPRLDLSRVDLSRPVKVMKIRREILFVPASMRVVDLLVRMQSTRVHLALVVDEYGGTDGLVAIEDLLEQIVGDIEGEHDASANGGALFIDDPKLGLIAHARTPIDALEAHMGVSLILPEREDDVDTIGGLVFSLVGRIPVRGELVPHPSGIEFEVLDADPRRIKKLRIHKTRKPRRKTPSDKGTEGAIAKMPSAPAKPAETAVTSPASLSTEPVAAAAAEKTAGPDKVADAEKVAAPQAK